MNLEVQNESSTRTMETDEQRPQERVIKRRIRIGKKYHHVQNNVRKQLINRVEKKGEKIIHVILH